MNKTLQRELERAIADLQFIVERMSMHTAARNAVAANITRLTDLLNRSKHGNRERDLSGRHRHNRLLTV